MAYDVATLLLDGVEMVETGGVSGACMEPHDGVVAVVEAGDVPSEICRDGGAVKPPET